jgi:hypothetical protein
LQKVEVITNKAEHLAFFLGLNNKIAHFVAYLLPDSKRSVVTDGNSERVESTVYLKWKPKFQPRYYKSLLIFIRYGSDGHFSIE